MDAAGLEHATKLEQVVSRMDESESRRTSPGGARDVRHLSVLFDAACDAISSHVASL